MEINILNGGALIDRMEAAGFDNLIVCHECLIDGPVDVIDIDEFWNKHAAFIDDTYGLSSTTWSS